MHCAWLPQHTSDVLVHGLTCNAKVASLYSTPSRECSAAGICMQPQARSHAVQGLRVHGGDHVRAPLSGYDDGYA